MPVEKMYLQLLFILVASAVLIRNWWNSDKVIHLLSVMGASLAFAGSGVGLITLIYRSITYSNSAIYGQYVNYIYIPSIVALVILFYFFGNGLDRK